MNVLVTGSNGFVGRNLVPYLRGFGIHVDTLDMCSDLGELYDEQSKHIYYRLGSYLDNSFSLEQYDVILHLAAQSHVDRSITGPREFIDDNVSGTLELLEKCKPCIGGRLKRIILLSTDEVGACLETGEFLENGPFKCGSVYSASKAAQECLFQAYSKTWNLPINIVRSVNIFGPHQADEKFLPTVIKNALEEKCIPIYGDGYQERQWVYVDHVCSFLHDLTTATYIAPDSTVHITGTSCFPNLMIAQLVLGWLKKDVGLIQHVEDRKGHDVRYALGRGDSTDCWSLPEYKNKFVEDLMDTVNWYKEKFNGQRD